MAIRAPKRFANDAVRTKERTDCHTSDVGHWFAMTVETLETHATDQRFANLEVGWFLKSFNHSGHRSTPRQGDKRSAPQGYLLRGTAADLIASNALLRTRRHKVRPVSCQHYPRGFKGIAIPLARLSPLSFVVQRKIWPPEVVARRTRPVKT